MTPEPNPLHADHAERVVVACAIASPHGAQLAAVRVTPAMFRDARYRALFTAAVACPLVDPDDRIHDVAHTTGQHHLEVARIVDDRPVMWDTSGGYADRVAAAHERRNQATVLLAQLDDLGIDVHAVELAR